jgi:hypothetical protein
MRSLFFIVRHAMPLFVVRIFNLTKRTGLLLMPDIREKVPKGCESFRGLSPMGGREGKIFAPLKGRQAISARTLYIKTSRGYTSNSGVEKNNYLSAQKRNLLLR